MAGASTDWAVQARPDLSPRRAAAIIALRMVLGYLVACGTGLVVHVLYKKHGTLEDEELLETQERFRTRDDISFRVVLKLPPLDKVP